jgi:hypothetical protein
MPTCQDNAGFPIPGQGYVRGNRGDDLNNMITRESKKVRARNRKHLLIRNEINPKASIHGLGNQTCQKKRKAMRAMPKRAKGDAEGGKVKWQCPASVKL